MIKKFRLDIRPLGQSPRKVYIYLPNDYATSNKTYDVLYMFDGHNTFRDEDASYGKSWGMEKYLDENPMDLVVVGVDCNHSGFERLYEYCPYDSFDRIAKKIYGKGDITAKWFVEKLKPFVESRYRVHSSREHVGIAGSSMGGLMSLYFISKYNHVYSKAACLASSTEFSFKKLLKIIKNADMNPDTKIYMMYGGDEVGSRKMLSVRVDQMLQINHEFNNKGCQTYPQVVVNGLHDEATWESCVPTFLNYLFK